MRLRVFLLSLLIAPLIVVLAIVGQERFALVEKTTPVVESRILRVLDVDRDTAAIEGYLDQGWVVLGFSNGRVLLRRPAIAPKSTPVTSKVKK